MRIPRSVYRVVDRRGRGPDRRTWPASFADRLTSPVPSRRAVTRLILEGGLRPDLSEVSDLPVATDRGLPPLDAGGTSVTWVGHASCVVRIGGLVVLTDPVWSRRIPGVRARYLPPGLAWADLPPVDAVVISHDHLDHLDAPTVRRLPRDVAMLVPGGLGWWFRRHGFRRVIELDWWESTIVGGVEFQFVPAHHWSRRTLFDTCRSLWGGWVLTDRSRRVHFAGDSGYGPYFAQIGERCPGIDVALLPVGAFQPRWFMKAQHMNPAEAVRACADLGAARMATIHWGTFALSAESPLTPVRQARAAWAAAGRPAADLWDLAVGETRILPATDRGEAPAGSAGTARP
jgi:L-ascorbate metabolism protein UlaG (beta-lactamase superfamily)